MTPSPEPEPTNGSTDTPESREVLIKVVDRRGKVKMIPRAEFEARKRRRKRHEATKSFPFKEVISIILILGIICLASYIAFHFVK